MNRKSKRLIIGLVIAFILVVGIFIVQSVASSNSAAVVYDLRIMEVYLSADEDNNFEIELSYGVSSGIRWVISSSDQSVAKAVRVKGRVFKVTYFKAGQATLTAHPDGSYAITDSFVLTVKENYPAAFAFDTEDKNVEAINKISLYADEKDYVYHFETSALNDESVVNNSLLSVVEDYDTNVFETVEINSSDSTLTLKAKQSVSESEHVLTIQCKTQVGKEETVITNFNIIVVVKGYFIDKLQMQVSETTHFDDGTVYIIGEGELKEGEIRINNTIYLFRDVVDTFYVKVRGVYTNGDYKDITNSENLNLTDMGAIVRQKIGGYQKFYINTADIVSQSLTFSYHENETVSLLFTIDYGTSMDDTTAKTLYEKVNEGAGYYYTYKYWDERYKRNDEITEGGKIVGFINGDPGYSEVFIESTSEEE